jgi:hypothetical protein
MVRHHDVVENSQRHPLVCFLQNALKRLVIGFFFKQCQPGHSPIQAVEHHPGRTKSLRTRHAGSLADPPG